MNSQYFSQNVFTNMQKPIQALIELNVKTLQSFSYVKPEELLKLQKTEDLVKRNMDIFIHNSHKAFDHMQQTFEIFGQQWLRSSDEIRANPTKVVIQTKTVSENSKKTSVKKPKLSAKKSVSTVKRAKPATRSSVKKVAKSNTVAAKSGSAIAKSTKVAPKSKRLVAKSTKVAPKSKRLVAKSTKVAPKSRKLVAKSTKVAVKSSRKVVARPSKVVAKSSRKVVARPGKVVAKSSSVHSARKVIKTNVNRTKPVASTTVKSAVNGRRQPVKAMAPKARVENRKGSFNDDKKMNYIPAKPVVNQYRPGFNK